MHTISLKEDDSLVSLSDITPYTDEELKLEEFVRDGHYTI